MGVFSIDGNSVISFSGGRTSGALLKSIIDANNGLPSSCLVCFQNTGKEHEETLEFVRSCAFNWGVEIIWLEYDIDENNNETFKIVDFETASRNGEPFEKMIRKKKMLPNPIARICTIELKAKTLSRYLVSLGWTEFTNIVGIRADEPKRWDNNDGVQYEKDKDGNIKYYKRTGLPIPLNKLIKEEKYAPFRYSGFKKEDRDNFWREQNFDLAIDSEYSNCDYCYLKGGSHLMQKMKERPSEAKWWADMENIVGNTFRSDRPNYGQMMIIARDQGAFEFGIDDRALPCFCTD